jgi:hypothetical protein
MSIRTELWTLSQAKAWLNGHEWGTAIAETIEDDPTVLREAVWISMVMDMAESLSYVERPESEGSPSYTPRATLRRQEV